ncbi:M3 family oligoendopeptidase [Paenibacillaceae bacterium WGS1546]|uniref:M3 family oligoendopeptidase n=1 Tax=Cohnella sp. WGS1546 TaxID=3366810 RepID=UPI00372CF121
MTQDLSMRWNMESLFAGGSSSARFAAFVEETESLNAALLEELREAGDAAPDADRLAAWTNRLQDVLARLREAESFVGCLAAQDMTDKRAVAWIERIQTLSARFKQAGDLYEAGLAAVPEESWRDWSDRPELAPYRFPLHERRELARKKLPPALEAVASELAVDGYHGWSEHYNTIVGRIAIPWEENGQTVRLSAGQAANKLEDADPSVRDTMFAKWEEAWAEQADLSADALNRLAGFRLKLYGLRRWNDPLEEPLLINRMSRETLEAMWSAVEGGIEPLKRYLTLKAGKLGKAKPGWHDIDAPIASSQAKMAYGEAAELIAESFDRFSPDMARLAREAFDERWIEAEDRPGKRPGGFCTSFPLGRQSRIFMTYSGTPGNVSTLAHELGHAYHARLVQELPPLAQEYAMNVAETASTFAEALVGDALLSRAESGEEKLALLDERLQRAVAFCMNIRARYLFETRFYERRRTGMLEAAELSELMVAAQKEAFGDALSGWHPHFWASKLHFYLTDVPFYNFPYTFGYLFSTGLSAIASNEGASFARKYDDLLRDTGRMTVERLANRHLGVALDRPDFWNDAVSRAVADVEAFAELCGK